MPNTGRDKYEEIPSDESTEEYVPMRRADGNDDNTTLEADHVLGISIGGKSLLIAKHPHNAGYYFKWKEGGALPPSLDGLWTTFHLAEREGNIYLKNQPNADTASK